MSCISIVSVQNILPSTIVQEVKELFIPSNEVEIKRQEAKKLPSVQLTKV